MINLFVYTKIFFKQHNSGKRCKFRIYFVDIFVVGTVGYLTRTPNYTFNNYTNIFKALVIYIKY